LLLSLIITTIKKQLERKMAVLKLNGLARATLIALVMLAASAQMARAKTLYLECRFPDAPAGVAPDTYTIDLAKNTVNNHPATINETAIDWVQEQGYSDGTIDTRHFHLDRTTGTLKGEDTDCYQSGRHAGSCITSQWREASTCTKRRAPATKF
jgi:hypothetical protein